MNGRERILAILSGGEVDRVPWIPYTGVHIGALIGADATELLTDGAALGRAALEANRRYFPDGQPIAFDLQIEAEALGCELLWSEKTPPTVKTHPYAGGPGIPKTVPEKDAGRIPVVLEAMERARKEIGGGTALYGLFTGPLTLASHLRGTDIFLDMYDDPDYVKQLLAFCTDVGLRMCEYYAESGMDVLASVDPMVSQISPDAFAQFLEEPYRRLFASIKDRGVGSAFFVCGDATPNLAAMADTGPDCLSVDENIDMAAARAITDKRNIVLSGNIPLTTVMLHGTQQDNQKYALDLMDLMQGSRFILAPGCDVPFDVPPENIVGVAQAVQDPQATRRYLSGYVKKKLDVHVEMPDYGNLARPLVEIFTVDSDTCAACGYMKEAAFAVAPSLEGRADFVERKITETENIARAEKLGLRNLPAILVNGEVKFSSIIPDRDRLRKEIESVL